MTAEATRGRGLRFIISSNTRNRVHESVFKYEWPFQKDAFIAVQGGARETVQRGRSTKTYTIPQRTPAELRGCSTDFSLPQPSFWSAALPIGDRIRACFPR